jgi:hypothetical protein
VPDYESGWVNITDKAGKYYTLTHNLNNDSNVLVDITGKTTVNGSAHDQYLGLSRVYSSGFSQTYVVNGSRTYGESLVQTYDGVYVLAGTISDGVIEHVFVVKTDSNGEMQWNQTYDSATDMSSRDIIQTNDGGFLVSGYVYVGEDDDTYNDDLFLMKIDAKGNLVWNQTYGGTQDEYCSDLIQTSDGCYMIVGDSYPLNETEADDQALLIKIDDSGNILWNKTYPAANGTQLNSAIEISDGYVLTGYMRVENSTTNSTQYDIWLFKTDLNGNMLWNRTYGETDDYYVDSVYETVDGGYALSGSVETYGNDTADSGIFVMKTDASGSLLWNKTNIVANITFSEDITEATFYYETNSIQTIDGGYAFSGVYMTIHVDDDDTNIEAVTIKTDSQGNIQWNKTVDITGNNILLDIIQTRDGGFALGGFFSADSDDQPKMCIVKTAVNGEFGLAWTNMTENTITLYRGDFDPYWNYVRVKIWVIK